MSDETWYKHGDEMYGYYYDHTPSGGGSLPYVPCDLDDIEEIQKQREIVYEKMRVLKRPYEQLGKKYKTVGIISFVMFFFSTSLTPVIPLALLIFGICMYVKGRKISKTLDNERCSYSPNTSPRRLNDANSELSAKYYNLTLIARGMNKRIKQLENQQTYCKKGSVGVVNRYIDQNELNRINNEINEIDSRHTK